MLRFLRIEHLAVIESAEVEFESGLNVLTGETGAGKSMLVEAVGLLMGGRASSDLIRTGEAQAVVQAVFEPEVNGRELIVRREITSQGRSRAYVNGALVTASLLEDQTSPLVELHGQHEHQVLLDPDSHLTLLDEFAGLRAERNEVATAYRTWRSAQNDVDALHMDERERAARLDLLSFQVGELQRAILRPDEDLELETARRVLSNADKLQRLCGEAYSVLYDSDESALSRLSIVWKRVAELAEVDPMFKMHLESREAIKSQLEELAFALRAYGEGIDASPRKLQEVEDRLALLERLKKKYGPSLAEVIASRESLQRQFEGLQNADQRMSDLTAAADAARKQFLSCARGLSVKRRKSAEEFRHEIESLLSELAMPRAKLEFRFQPEAGESSWSEHGVDSAECYLSANIGEDVRPLAKIASGGELSRVMLAVRTLSAADTPGKTLIFDEVDAGIGGRVADVVGKKLRRIGDAYQVICITHLPQIAASAHAHFHISKSVIQGRTHTHVRRLDDRARVDELARMMGGAEPGDASRAAARELLDLGAKGESERAKAKVAGRAKPR